MLTNSRLVRNPGIGAGSQKDGEYSDALDMEGAHAVRMSSNPGLEWFQAHPYGKSRLKRRGQPRRVGRGPGLSNDLRRNIRRRAASAQRFCAAVRLEGKPVLCDFFWTTRNGIAIAYQHQFECDLILVESVQIIEVGQTSCVSLRSVIRSENVLFQRILTSD